MKMYVAGQWIDKDEKIEVRNSYDGSVIDVVPRADRADIERALQSAERGARAMAKLSSYERWKILHRAADLLSARAEELGTLISKEEGKILAEGRVEALRAVDTIMESAEEAKRVHGETVALDGASHRRSRWRTIRTTGSPPGSSPRTSSGHGSLPARSSPGTCTSTRDRSGAPIACRTAASRSRA